MKKQKNLFYYLKHKKTIFIFFFFLGFYNLSLEANDPSSPAEAMLQAPYLYQSVNVITGEYCEANTDFISPLIPEIPIRRCFSNETGWTFNLPLIQNGDIEDTSSPFIYQYNKKSQLEAILKHDLNPVLQIAYSLSSPEGMSLTTNGNTFDYEFMPVDSRTGIFPFFLKSVSHQGTELCRYSYCSHPFLRKQLLVSKENNNGYCCINEYYDKKFNEIDDKRIIIEDPVRDFRIGRVKLQKTRSGEGETEIIVAKYFYYPNYTEVFDALNRKTIYRYNSGRLIATENYIEGSLYRSERLIWKKGSEKKPDTLSAKVWEDASGSIIKCITYEYDSNGNQVVETLHGILSGTNNTLPILDEKGKVQSNGAESYSKRRIYSETSPFLLLSETEDNGKTITYSYDQKTKYKTAEFTGTDTTIFHRRIFERDEKNRLIALIIDDGTSFDTRSMQGVTERRATIFTYHEDHQNSTQPHVIEEKYFNDQTGQFTTTQRTLCSYNEQGYLCLKKVFNQSGNLASSITYTYDTLGRVTLEMNEKGTGIEKKYDHQNHVIQEIVFENNKLAKQNLYSYDLAGKLTGIKNVDPTGITTTQTFDYNDASEKIAATDSYDNTTTYVYDDLGRLIEIRLPDVFDGQSDCSKKTAIRYTYDILNNITATIDPKDNQTTIRYNAYGKPIEKIYPDATKESFSYFLDGSLKETINQVGIKTRFKRDILERELSITVCDAASTIYFSLESVYSAFHLLKTIKDGKLTTHYTYDQAGRITLKEQIFPEGMQSVQFQYDQMGRLESQIQSWDDDSEGFYTEYIYKEDGSLYKTRITDLQRILLKEITHDISELSNENIKESSTTNNLGQVVRQTIAKENQKQEIISVYDALGRIETLMVKDNHGKVDRQLRLEYDLTGNTIKETFYGSQSTPLKVNTKHYDSCNRLLALTESAGTSHSRTTYYHYNSLGQLEKVVKPNGVEIIHHYTPLGLLKDYYASDFSFKYQFFYDEQGLLTRVEDIIFDQSTERSYNTFGQITYEKLGNGLHVKNAYDSIGRRLQLTLPDSSSIRYYYDPLYLRTIERYSQRNELAYSHSYTSYNLQGKLLEASLIGHAGTLSFKYNQKKCFSISCPHWSEVIPDFSQDLSSNILSTEGHDVYGRWQSNYSYNDNDELVAENGTFEHEYSYDKNGNRTSRDLVVSEYDLLNQLLSLQTGHDEDQRTFYSYDLNGNLIEKISNGSEKTFYRYDALDRLINVEIENSLFIEYVYDAFYRRLIKTVSKWDVGSLKWMASEAYTYLYDEDREIGMVDSQGKIIELRVLGIPTAVESRTEISSAIAHEINGQCFAPIHDHRGNVCCLIDSQSGIPAESYRYSAFGNSLIYSDSGKLLNETSLNNPWLFSSKRKDSETGLIYYGKRYYDPDIGRWISKDPLGEDHDISPYHFLNNNPLNHVDLYGLFSIPTISKEAKEMGFFFFDALNKFKKNASYEPILKQGWNQTAEQFFDKGFLQFAGHYSDPISSGTSHYGEEMHDKVRITLINGILNVRYDLDLMVKLFSASHGDTKIHYVYRPTEGWTKDMFSSVASKFGFSSPQAKLLAKKWKDLIREMGGVGQGGKIIHYAHSIGAADSYIAKNLLTKEEQRMIHVISIGSPTMIPNDSGFASVINYVSKRDGVCLLDPIGYAMGYFYENSKIEWVGSIWGIPLIDHTLSTDSYGGVIKELGAKFVQTHLSNY